MVRKRRTQQAATRSDGNFLGRWSRRKVRAKTDAPPDTLEEDLALESGAQARGTGSYQNAGHQPGRMITDAPKDHDAPISHDTGESGGTRHADELASLDTSRTAGADEGDAAPANPNGLSAGEDESDETFAGQDWDKFDFDTLDGESDYAKFMGKNIPDHIRAKALKKLWSSNPLFGHMDLLDDYAEDFTDAVWVVPNLRTDYKVGRGFMTDEEVAEWEALGAESKQRAEIEQRERDKAKRDGDAPGPGDDISIAPESPDQPDVIAMLKASEDYHRLAYPQDRDPVTPVSDLLAPNVRFLVVRVHEQVAGCGALIYGNADIAQLKRMWVDPEMRGEGLGRALLLALESEARKLNVTRVRLAAGIDDVAAVKLFRGSGYLEQDASGSRDSDVSGSHLSDASGYRDSDASGSHLSDASGYREPTAQKIFMEKTLVPADQSTD